MGQTVSQSVRLNIVDSQAANTPLEPLSEDGFVWLFVNQVPSIPGTINVNNPVWIKLSIPELISLPVYDQQDLVHIQTTQSANGTLVGTYYKSTSLASIRIEVAFTSISVVNNILSIVALGVLPPAAKESQDLYAQHSTLAPQIPQVSTSDLLAEIIQRQSNPLDSRKLTENVTITVGQQTVINNNLSCVKKCKDHHCKKCNHKH